VAVSGSPIAPAQWDFVVFRSEQINAFALPGHVGAFEGMMTLVGDDDAELAAVVGHEVGHVVAHHSAQRVGTEEITQLGIGVVAAALQLGGDADAQTASCSALVPNMAFSCHSRTARNSRPIGSAWS
jgi:predicted Zn-dependent protease